MKRVFSLLLALVLALGLTACGGKEPPSNDPQPPAEPAQPETTQPSEPAPEPEAGGYPVTITTYDYEGNEIETTYEKAPAK